MVFGILFSVGMMIVPSIILTFVTGKSNKDVTILVGTAKD